MVGGWLDIGKRIEEIKRDADNFTVKHQHLGFNMSTPRNVKEHIIAKLQNTCFETKVISGSILKVVEIEHDSPPIRWGLHVVSSSRVHYGKRGKNNFTVEKSVKQYLRQVIKVNNNSDKLS